MVGVVLHDSGRHPRDDAHFSDRLAPYRFRAYVELFKNLPLTIIMVFMVLGAYAQLKFSFSDTFATNFFWLA